MVKTQERLDIEIFRTNMPTSEGKRVYFIVGKVLYKIRLMSFNDKYLN